MPLEAPAIADVIETVIKTALGPITARLRALEGKTLDPDPIAVLGQRVAELEARPANLEPAAADESIRFDSYRVEYDGERTFTHTWCQGEKTVAIPFIVPLAIYRGIWLAGKEYQRGDLVTDHWQIYHCNTATTIRPSNGDKAWTLAVKRGRDDRERGRA